MNIKKNYIRDGKSFSENKFTEIACQCDKITDIYNLILALIISLKAIAVLVKQLVTVEIALLLWA